MVSSQEPQPRAPFTRPEAARRAHSLVVPGYTGLLVDARKINDDGTITGSALDADTGDLVTFVATPVGGAGGSD